VCLPLVGSISAIQPLSKKAEMLTGFILACQVL
jgi:hypothetical protein